MELTGKIHLWAYSVSHGQLLFRGNKDHEHDTRREVLFKGVGGMKVLSVFEGLRIAEMEEDAARFLMGTNTAALARLKVFRLESGGFRGWVAALAMFTKEDQLDYGDPSLLMNPMTSPGASSVNP